MTKTQERKNKRGMEALFLSSPVATTKEKSIGDKEGKSKWAMERVFLLRVFCIFKGEKRTPQEGKVMQN